MPRAVNMKSPRIELHVTLTEKRAWQQCASADGRRLTEWMRWRLNEAVAKRKGKK